MTTGTQRNWERVLELTYEHMATKQQVDVVAAQMATKVDLERVERKVDGLGLRMDSLESKVDLLESKLDLVLEAVRESDHVE